MMAILQKGVEPYPSNSAQLFAEGVLKIIIYVNDKEKKKKLIKMLTTKTGFETYSKTA